MFVTNNKDMTIRELIDDKANKIWRAYIENTTLHTETGKIGKNMRKTEKEFASLGLAKNDLRKKEWAKLKKDFIYRNADAEAGEALFHSCTKGMNQSQFPIVRMNGHICCIANYSKATYVVVYNDLGQEIKRISIPQGTVYDMQGNEKHNTLYLTRSKKVVSLHLETEEYSEIYAATSNYYVNISVGENRVAWASSPDIGGWDIVEQKMVFQHSATKLATGTNHVAGSVSLYDNDTKMMICRAGGRIDIWDIEQQMIDKDIDVDFQYINSKVLVDKNAQYAIFDKEYELHYIDLNDGAICEESLLDLPKGRDLLSYAFSPSGQQFAVAQWNVIYIYDWTTKEQILKINIEHMIKKAFVGFLSEDVLMVHTDYHCLSTYKIR